MSQLITTVGRINSRMESKPFVLKVKVKHPTTSHHCWAYIAGQPEGTHQYDQAMLNALTHSGLGNNSVVVIRYFGSIKLDTDELVHA